MPLVLKTAKDDDGRRLDRILRKYFGRVSPELPLSAIHRMLRKGEILVDGRPCGAEYRVKANQTIEIPQMKNEQRTDKGERRVKGQGERPLFPKTDGLGLDVLYEGDGLLIVNKPSGIAVHGPDSLEDFVLDYLEPRLPSSVSFRPGPLHRLDKLTSGIIVFSANLEGAQYFSSLLRERLVIKRYIAIVDGIIEENETWEDLLVRDRQLRKTFTNSGESREGKAKAAKSQVTALASRGNRTLILVEIKTGRTHQIRTQAAARGHPLSADKKYGGLPIPENKTGFFLHAMNLDFASARRKTISIKAPLPETFKRMISRLFGDSFAKVRDFSVFD